MLDVIEKLLILQDCDRKILRVKEEVGRVEPERREMLAKTTHSQSNLEAAKHHVKQIESDRKKIELDVEAKKQQIEKYSLQQFQTKKNEEYRALAHEIEMCKEAIVQFEDQELELMEQGDAAQREANETTRSANEIKKLADGQIAGLNQREQTLQKELTELEARRGELAETVEEGTRLRYDRTLKKKGSSVVVGIDHGVCGGCHMQLSRQVVVQCQAEQEIVSCPNCGRILYFMRGMDVAVAE